jgi:hypothetical protein
MTDPAHVNERIAALMGRYQNHYWCVPEALAEVRSLWGEGANEHGVFCRYERGEVANLSDSCKAAMLVAGQRLISKHRATSALPDRVERS